MPFLPFPRIRCTPLLAALSGVAASVAHSADAPSMPRIATPFHSSTSVELVWDDNSSDEDAFEYELYLENSSGEFDLVFTGTTLRSQTLTTLTGGAFGNVLEFRVRALSSTSGDSDWTDRVRGTFPSTSTAMLPGAFVGGFVGQPIAPFTPSGINTTSFTVSALPPGLAAAPATGVVTGTPTAPGVFRALVTGTDGTSDTSTFVTFRLEHPPAPPHLSSMLPDVETPFGVPVSVDLNLFFDDPDTAAAARMVTTLGTIDIILYERAAPASVENFLNYVNDGDLDASLFHRVADRASAGVDIIQSGWFKPAPTSGYVSVPTDPAVPNEPGMSNVRGTIAMAKQGGNPNSGTSQTYFNANGNSALDPATNNGGFAVFGRATTPTLPVVDAIFALPRGTYDTMLDGAPRNSLSDWPTLTGAPPAPEEIVQALTVTELSNWLTFQTTGISAPEVAGATVVDSVLDIAAVGVGTCSISVAATDLDGTSTQSTFVVSVLPNYAFWASEQTFPNNLSDPLDDGESDLIPNVLEYALLGDPSASDVSVLPLNTGGSLTFSHRKDAPDLTYRVEASADLETWESIWQTSDGNGHPTVMVVADDSQSCRLAVTPPPGSDAPFLRLRIDLAAGQP